MHIACCADNGTTLPDNAPGDYQALSGLELGAAAARDPQYPAPINDTTRAKVNLRAREIPHAWENQTPRQMGNPSQRIEEVRTFDGAVGWGNEHQLYDAGASMAEGQQTALPRVNANTWRARPQAWDTNLYQGATPPAAIEH